MLGQVVRTPAVRVRRDVRSVDNDERSSPSAMVAKKHYSVRQTYWIAHDAVRTIRHFARLRADGERFTERLMLAVTEVNGCALCAYGHTRFALEAGLSGDEIRELLAGAADGVPDEELAAIAFAQHYAATEGHPDRLAWTKLVEEYGEDRALGILGAVRMIMWGNAVGIPWSALLSRLRGAPYPRSSLRYEIGTVLADAAVMPVAVMHAGISRARGVGAQRKGAEPAASSRPPRKPRARTSTRL